MIYRRKNGTYGVTRYNRVTQKMDWIGTYSSMREAKAADRLAERGGTVADYRDRWLSSNPQWAAATARKYATLIEPFVVRFGSCALSEIPTRDVVAWALGVSRPSWEVARAMLNAAIADGWLDTGNPLTAVRPSQIRADIGVTADDLSRITDAAVEVWGEYGERAYAPTLTCMAHAGLYSREIQEARKIDLLHDRLVVKTARGSQAALLLPPMAREAARYAAEYSDGPWLFTNKVGGQLRQWTLFYYLNAVRRHLHWPALVYDNIRGFGNREVTDVPE